MGVLRDSLTNMRKIRLSWLCMKKPRPGGAPLLQMKSAQPMVATVRERGISRD